MSIAVNQFYNEVSMAEKILADLAVFTPEAHIVNRNWETEFGAKNKGDTIDVDVPVRLLAKEGHKTIQQSITTQTTQLTVNNEWHVAYPIKSTDRTLNKQAFYKKYLKPAAEALSIKISESIRDEYKGFSMFAGTAGTTPASSDVVGEMAKRLVKNGVPLDNRFLLLDPDAYYDIQAGEKSLSPQDLVKQFILQGTLPQVKGFNVMMSNIITTHTKGAGSGYVIDGANQTGKNILVKTGTGALNKGDIITIASVNAVNPRTGDSLGFVREFTLDADYSGGGGTITVSPPIENTDPYKTVDALPADAAVITQIASHVPNMALSKEAITLAMVDIMPAESTPSAFTLSQDGFSVTVEIWGDSLYSADIIKVRAMWAVKNINQEFGGRLLG
jgi:hypothetical protein